MSLIYGLLLTGPTLSIIHNLHQVQNTTQCLADSVQSHAQELRGVYNSAYRDVSDTISESVGLWRNAGQAIESVIGPVRNAFNTASEAIRNFDKTVKNIRNNCRTAINFVRQSKIHSKHFLKICFNSRFATTVNQKPDKLIKTV